jgi:hypothetical protein
MLNAELVKGFLKERRPHRFGAVHLHDPPDEFAGNLLLFRHDRV